MRKGNINNNLNVFNDMYEDLFLSLSENANKLSEFRNQCVGISNNFQPIELLDFCKNEIDEFSKGNILTLGGGPGIEACVVKNKYPSFNLYSSDISPWAMKIGEKFIDKDFVFFHTCDMIDLCFEDCFFNVILSIHSLEHTSDIEKSMSEIVRTIKGGGIFGLAYPYGWSTDEQHVYEFNDDLQRYMSSFGDVLIGESKDYKSKILKVVIEK